MDISNLSEVDGYRHVIVLINYFSKWLEAKPTKDKSALTIAQFLYEVNQQPRSEICKWSMQTITWMNGSRTESYVCLSSLAERIDRTSKTNNKELFGKGFGR